MKARTVLDALRALCRDIDDGRSPRRIALGRIAGPLALPVAIGFAGVHAGCSDNDEPPGHEVECSDGVDEDRDGRTDCEDDDCASTTECYSLPPYSIPFEEDVCDDGLDNDIDTLTDCDDDDCSDAPICNALPAYSAAFESECDDDVDNDGDTLVDCDDEDCRDQDVCAAGSG